MTHIDALLALAPAGHTVYDSTTPAEPAYPYLLLGAPHFPQLRLALDADARPVGGYFTITVVGLTATQVRAALAFVRAAYDRARPVVDGFDAWVRLDSSAPLVPDTTMRTKAGSHPVYAVDRYRYDATPT